MQVSDATASMALLLAKAQGAARQEAGQASPKPIEGVTGILARAVAPDLEQHQVDRLA